MGHTLRLALVFTIATFVGVQMYVPVAEAQTGNVGIGTTTPNNSAILELATPTTPQGLLIPRMTQAQRNAIASPATGLLVFCTDSVNTTRPSTFYYYTGTAWVPFLGGGWLTTGNFGTTPTVNFLGTTDNQDFVIKTNSVERLRVYAGGHVGLMNSNNTAEELRFYEPSDSGSNYTGFRAGPQAANVTYTLPPADGTSAQVLTTDGAGNLSWRSFGFVGGGGVDTLWKRGTGLLSLVGVGTGNSASGAYAIAAGLNSVASGTYAIAYGSSSTASGTASAVSGGESNTASGNYSSVGGGQGNTASGDYSNVGGGRNNTACGMYSAVLGGFNNTACGDYSVAVGGANNSVTGNYSMVFGNGASVTQANTVVFNHTTNNTLVGIRNNAPTEALDVTGSIRFSGALMPNNQPGTSGYVLASQGAGSPPVWLAASNLYWSTLGNSGTNPASQYLGTTDAQPIVFRTNATERARILATGNVGINTTTPTHLLHSVNATTTDELAAIYGVASAATSAQAIGVWGAANSTSSTNTGTIGVLASGNGNSTAGQTNVALQINDGEFAMGRTTEAPSVGAVVENAAAGSAYSQQGPSGVIEFTLGAGGNLTTSAPTAGAYQSLGTVTINNRYVNTSSIVLVSVLTKTDDGVAPSPLNAVFFADVDNRASGSFVLQIGMIPTATSVANFSTSDKIRVGYTVVNPGK